MAAEVIEQENAIILAAAEKMVELGSTISQRLADGKMGSDSTADYTRGYKILALLTAYKDNDFTVAELEAVLYDLLALSGANEFPTVEPIVGQELIYETVGESFIIPQDNGTDLTQRSTWNFYNGLTATDAGTRINIGLGGTITAATTLTLSANLTLTNGAGSLAFNAGSDATGDLLYRNSSGKLARLGIVTGVLGVTTGLPTWQTVVAPLTMSGGNLFITTGALTRVDDTNVTLTLGGGHATALLAATSLTLGWTGTLSAARGGTGTGTYVVGDLLYANTTSTLTTLADVAAGSYLRSGGVSTAPLWSTLILPNSATANQVVYATSTNTYGGSANLTFNGSLVTVSSTNGGISTGIVITHSAAGNGNYSSIVLNNDVATLGQLFLTSSTYNLASAIPANSLGFYNSGNGGITIVSDNSTGFIKFTTGTGATSANERLRILAGGSVVMGTTAITGTGEYFLMRKDANAGNLFSVMNATSGTIGLSAVLVSTSASYATSMQLIATSAGYTPSGMLEAGMSVLYNNSTNGLNLGTQNSAQVSIWTNNTKRISIAAADGTTTFTPAAPASSIVKTVGSGTLTGNNVVAFHAASTFTMRATSSDFYLGFAAAETITTGSTNQSMVGFQYSTLYNINHTGATVYGFRYLPQFGGSQLSSLTHVAQYHNTGYIQWASVLSPSQITSNQNDYNPTGWTNGGAPYGASITRLNTDASRNITSWTGGVEGRLHLAANVGGFRITETDDDGATGTAANRNALPANDIMEPDDAWFKFYDDTSDRWRIVGVYYHFTSTLRGLVPASGGGSTTYLRADGTWVDPLGGGGSISGLTAGRVTLSASATSVTDDADFTYNSGTNTLAAPVINASSSLSLIGSSSGGLDITSLNAGTGHAGVVWQRTAGTTGLWLAYLPSGSTDLRLFDNTADRFTFTTAGLFTAASLQATGLTATRVPFVTTSGLLTDASTLTFTSGSGTLAATALQATGLTAGRVVYTSTSGLLTADANLLYNGTVFSVTKANEATYGPYYLAIGSGIGGGLLGYSGFPGTAFTGSIPDNGSAFLHHGGGFSLYMYDADEFVGFNAARDSGNAELDSSDHVYFKDTRTGGMGLEYFADYSASYSSRSLVDKEYVDDSIVAAADTVGDYTPTLFNTTNVSSSTAFESHYVESQGKVTVGITVNVSPTTTLLSTILGISLPISSAFSQSYHATGTALADNGGAIVGGRVYADTTNDRLILDFFAVGTSAHSFNIVVVYSVEGA